MKIKTLSLVSTTLIGVTLPSNIELAKADEGAENRLLEIPAGQVPTVDIVVTKDALKGWNL